MPRINEVYDNNTQNEWERLERHRTEFAVTMRAFQEHLPPVPAQILDIGGGPGRYSIALTKQGYQVTLLDLSQGNLALAQIKAGETAVELGVIIQGDGTSLPQSSQTYDAVLVMGPLYHLLNLEMRLQAVKEARRVLKPDGLIFAAFITRFAPLRDLAISNPEWIIENRTRFELFFHTGAHPAISGGTYADFYFAHPGEVMPFMETAGFETIKLIGCEGIVAGHEEKINQVTGQLWEEWVELNYQLGHEPTLLGAADHLLYIGHRK